jgi:hypothetical protein
MKCPQCGVELVATSLVPDEQTVTISVVADSSPFIPLDLVARLLHETEVVLKDIAEAHDHEIDVFVLDIKSDVTEEGFGSFMAVLQVVKRKEQTSG